ncbi:hypothetical protein QCA50_003143 [Cerrena zonata]|uniref:Uncharacterized protein n=1 Tax=Cerrena zonata TaxID=2478898 RepID=A0AAW0GR99_9APHY
MPTFLMSLKDVVRTVNLPGSGRDQLCTRSAAEEIISTFRSTMSSGPAPDIYTALPPINNQRIKFTSSTPFTPTFVKSTALASDRDHVYTSRVQGRQILLDNPLRESRTKKEREARKARQATEKAKVSAGILSRKEAKQKGLWKLARSETKFNSFIALHQLWLGYMSELMGLDRPPLQHDLRHCERAMPPAAGMHAKLVKADFHGSIITVRRSKNPCLVGLSGIVIHETENAFKIVTRKDQLKMIPKPHSVFSFAIPLYSTTPADPASALTQDSGQASSATSNQTTVFDQPHIEFELHGNQFCFRSADRANRKFKHKESIEL